MYSFSLQVKQVKNEAREISQNATSQSELIRSLAKANATSLVENARSEGLKYLYSELDITDQKQKASCDYLKTLRAQENVHLAVDFQQLIAGNLRG
jgi:cell division septum initiation protein DivIVA